MANNNKRHSFEWSRAWRRNGRGKQKVNCPSNEVRSIFLKNKSFKCFVVSVLKKNIKNWLYRVSQPQSRFCQVKNPSNVCESNLFVCTKNFFMTHLCKVINLIRIKCLPSLALGHLQGRGRENFTKFIGAPEQFVTYTKNHQKNLQYQWKVNSLSILFQ